MNRLLLLSVVVLTACPPVTMQPVDAGHEGETIIDAGFDAGTPDAGRPPRDAGIPDAGFVSAPVNQWCSLRGLAECFRHQRCGRGLPSQLPGCLTGASSSLICDQTAISRGVLGQRLSYDEGQAVECLNGFGSGSCEEEPASCKAVFTGRSPPDAGCLSELDCNADSFCDLYDSSCPHGCRPWSRLGETCDGFFRRCDPRVGSCDEGDGGIVMCVPLKTEGASCARYDACAEGLVCTNTKCVTRVAAPGGPCNENQGYPVCSDEYFCRQHHLDGGPGGTCQRKAGVGDTCVGGGTCLPSLRCTTLITTGVCAPKAGLREGCVAADDCQDGLGCDFKTQRCSPLPGDGGDCSYEASGYRCAPGHTCVFSVTGDDVCSAWKAPGLDCSYSSECASNDCEYGTLSDGGFGGRCRPSCSQRADGGLIQGP